MSPEMASQPERLTEDLIQTMFATPINTQLHLCDSSNHFYNNIYLLF